MAVTGRPVFSALTAADCSALAFEGAPLGSCAGEALHARAAAIGLPKLGDEAQLRMVIGSLLAATGASSIGPNVWPEVRDEARGLLLLSIRREGAVSVATAEAMNVLNKPAVVEKYRALGNRWTIAESSRDAPDAVERARRELGDTSAVRTGEWLRGLAESLEAPVEERPWWASKIVFAVVLLSAIFILGHVLLLARVLHKVHQADDRVLLYPLAGLSASALVGGFAVVVHRWSEPPKRA